MGCGCNSGWASNNFFLILVLFILLAIIFGACGSSGF